MLTAAPEYTVVAEHFRPHIQAAIVGQFMKLHGGKTPTPAQLEHVTDTVMKTIKLEIERASDMKQQPNVTISNIVEQIKATILAEFPPKVVTP